MVDPIPNVGGETHTFAFQVNQELKEKFLREELRALRKLIIRIMQWGVTLLVSLQTALFFVRQELLTRYLEVHQIPKTSGVRLPIAMHLIGTLLLLIVAFIVQQTARTIALRYVHYQNQLDAMNRPSGILELPPRMSMKWTTRLLFYLFPLFDILLRIFIKLSVEFKFF